MNIEDYVDEIHKKIGKNILLFQKLEGLLKYINLHFNVNIQNHDPNKFDNHTMGMLVNDHLNHNEKTTEFLNNDYLLSLHFKLSEDYCKNKEKPLKNLLEKRNDLVHQSFLKYDLSSIESCKEFIKELEDLEDEIKIELSELQQSTKHIINSKEKLKKIFSNVDNREMFLESLMENEIKNILLEKYDDLKESDNWVSLDIVGKFISNSLKKEYKVKSLKKFIEKSKIFEIKEKQNKKGKTRFFYKIKDGINFKIK